MKEGEQYFLHRALKIAPGMENTKNLPLLLITNCPFGDIFSPFQPLIKSGRFLQLHSTMVFLTVL
jgi:hypothetical protein